VEQRCKFGTKSKRLGSRAHMVKTKTSLSLSNAYQSGLTTQETHKFTPVLELSHFSEAGSKTKSKKIYFRFKLVSGTAGVDRLCFVFRTCCKRNHGGIVCRFMMMRRSCLVVLQFFTCYCLCDDSCSPFFL
jgi:hypothetical protein